MSIINTADNFSTSLIGRIGDHSPRTGWDGTKDDRGNNVRALLAVSTRGSRGRGGGGGNPGNEVWDGTSSVGRQIHSGRGVLSGMDSNLGDLLARAPIVRPHK